MARFKFRRPRFFRSIRNRVVVIRQRRASRRRRRGGRRSGFSLNRKFMGIPMFFFLLLGIFFGYKQNQKNGWFDKLIHKK